MSDAASFELADPRHFPDLTQALPAAASLYRLAQRSVAAETLVSTERAEGELRTSLVTLLAGNGDALAALLAGAPSVAVARQLWRSLEAAARLPVDLVSGVSLTTFAIPVVVVTGLESAAGEGTLSCVLDDPEAISAILREHGALGGNRTFALANALVGVDAIDVARLPELLEWQRLSDVAAEGDAPAARFPARVLAPAPIALIAGRESVSLRFLVGSAISHAGVDFLADAGVAKWGMPLTQALGRQIGGGRVPVLALPRAPQRLLGAVQQGRLAQREVSAQLFVGNALRKLRASVGEPTAVISAHRAPTAPGGGELRLSLSSPFEPRDAEGFRCPLYPLDRVTDVASTLVTLLRDCRVTDIRLLAEIYPDRDAHTGLPLLFKPETVPAQSQMRLH